MENPPKVNLAPRISAEEFRSFCQEGRFVGTPGNLRAGDFLKRTLEELGFAVLEEPLPALSGKRLLLLGVPLVAMAAILRDPWVFLALVPAGALLLLAEAGRARGAPAAIYGLRKADPPPSIPQEARPTVILCAHYDSASLPPWLAGSPPRQAFILLLLGAGIIGLGHLTFPGLVFAGLAVLVGTLFFMRNDSLGADDNASGVFAVIECLRRLGDVKEVNLVPAFFNYEEIGLIGSRVWARRMLSRRRPSLLGFQPAPQKTFVINFDTVGRGRHIYVSGSRKLRERLLQVARARTLPARRAYLYPSDHLSFRPRWNAVSVFRADRLWFLDLGWVHSRRDSPDRVRLDYLAEAAALVEAFVRGLASGAHEQPQKPSRPWARAFFSR